MKKQVSIGVLVIISVLILFSCKKNSPSSPAAYLAGTWKIYKGYLDTNKNDYRDINEIFTDTAFITQYFKFKPDGTYTISYYSTLTQGTWKFIYNNTYLKITNDTGAPVKYFFVENLTESNMELKDTTGVASGGFTEWFFYAKE